MARRVSSIKSPQCARRDPANGRSLSLSCFQFDMNAASSPLKITLGILAAVVLAARGWICQEPVAEVGDSFLQKQTRRASKLLLLSGIEEPEHFTATVQLWMIRAAGWNSSDGHELAAAIMAPDALHRVAESLGLAARWPTTPVTVEARLQKMAKVLPSKDKPSVITVKVTSGRSDEALEIADALASDFKSRLEATQTHRTGRISETVLRHIRKADG